MTFKLFSLSFYRVCREVVGFLSKVRGAINIIDTQCCFGEDFVYITSNETTQFSMQLPVNCHIAALDGSLVHLALVIVIVIVRVLTYSE